MNEQRVGFNGGPEPANSDGCEDAIGNLHGNEQCQGPERAGVGVGKPPREAAAQSGRHPPVSGKRRTRVWPRRSRQIPGKSFPRQPFVFVAETLVAYPPQTLLVIAVLRTGPLSDSRVRNVNPITEWG